MKHTISYISVLLFAMMAGGGLTASNRSGLDIYINGNDTIGQAKESYHWAIADTAAYMEEYRQNQNRNYDSKISLLARTYGDSIVLRWAPEDYVSWKYLNRVGVNIYRFDADNPIKVDTVAYALKPQPIEAWRAAYPQTDSIAGIAMGTLYGEGGFTQEQSKSRPGTMGALLDVHDDQQFRFAVAVLTTEWRRDIADKMAMRFVDRNVKKGKKYEYIVRPTEFDSTHHITFRVGQIEVENKAYSPQKFDLTMGDSLVGINTVRFWWENKKEFSTFEVERRQLGDENWVRINQNPYIMMRGLNEPDADNYIRDVVPGPGLYEYRVLGYDAFGDLTEPSHAHIVTVADINAPKPADLKHVIIDRRNKKELHKDVFATFYFRKDTLENDLIGYKILHYNPKDSVKWRPISNDLISPRDTMATLNVTGLRTTQVVVAAYDTAHNVSYSLPHVVMFTDYKAPAAPQNFRYRILDVSKGAVELSWDVPADDVDYYEIAYANDTTHKFMQIHNRESDLIRNTRYVDTLAVGVNQLYIYYKVRAVDYATNMGPYTPVLQVLRPSLIVPAEPHIDSTWVSPDKGVTMKWICSDEAQISYHILMRRLANSSKNWDIIGMFRADDVRQVGNTLIVTDQPKYNRKNSYEYAMKSVTHSGIESPLSLVYTVKYEGNKYFEWPIRLFGEYIESEKQTKIVWEMMDNPPYGDDWYFCIYRKGPNDDKPKFLMSADKTERMFQDRLLSEGETAEYYVMIQYAEGWASRPSNTVTVKSSKRVE
jgi:hypothetical protein